MCTNKLKIKMLVFVSSVQYLDSIRQVIHENLRHVAHAPSVEMQDIPPDLINIDSIDNLEIDPDVRNHAEEEERR